MQIGQRTKYVIKACFTFILFAGAATLIYFSTTNSPSHPLARDPAPEVIEFEYTSTVTKAFEFLPTPEPEELLSYIPDFIKTPEGGTKWELFADTKQNSYSYDDEEGLTWEGVRPEFSDDLKKLDQTEVLIQGYIFPLDNSEQQQNFLLGPFPMSCPYHYHVTPNLIIEVHTKEPIKFSYEPIDIKGQLELVPKDDEFNVFYRLKEAEILK